MFQRITGMKAKYLELLTVEIGEYGLVTTFAPEGIEKELLLEDPFSAIREFEESIRLDAHD